LKADEIESASWFTVDKGLTLTRNPFATWGLVEFFLQSPDARRALRVKRHGPLEGTRVEGQPTVFLDRDGVINRGRPGHVAPAAPVGHRGPACSRPRRGIWAFARRPHGWSGTSPSTSKRDAPSVVGPLGSARPPGGSASRRRFADGSRRWLRTTCEMPRPPS